MDSGKGGVQVRPGTNGGSERAWTIVGTGDFDGDGQPDILWQSRLTGEAVIWFMDGVVRKRRASIPLPGGAYTTRQIVGIGDFDRDGYPDILWQYRSRTASKLMLWHMKGAVRLSTEAIQPPEPSDAQWQVVAVADLDGDSSPDIVWQGRPTGEVLIWHMGGAAMVDQVSTDPASYLTPGWRVVGPK
jgi:hypothetical protein